MLRFWLLACLALGAQTDKAAEAVKKYLEANTREGETVIPVLVRGEPYDLHLKFKAFVGESRKKGALYLVTADFEDLRFDPGSRRFNEYQIEFEVGAKDMRVREMKTRLALLNGVAPKPLLGEPAPPPPPPPVPRKPKKK